MEKHYKCCICRKEKDGYGNSCWPLFPDTSEYRCCDNCNVYVVVPARIKEAEERKK